MRPGQYNPDGSLIFLVWETDTPGDRFQMVRIGDVYSKYWYEDPVKNAWLKKALLEPEGNIPVEWPR